MPPAVADRHTHTHTHTLFPGPQLFCTIRLCSPGECLGLQDSFSGPSKPALWCVSDLGSQNGQCHLCAEVRDLDPGPRTWPSPTGGPGSWVSPAPLALPWLTPYPAGIWVGGKCWGRRVWSVLGEEWAQVGRGGLTSSEPAPACTAPRLQGLSGFIQEPGAPPFPCPQLRHS